MSANPATAEVLLEAKGVTAGYTPGVNILNDCSLSLHRGEIVGIIGPNGAGKTTLMNVVSGFITARSGRVVVDGQDFLPLAPHKRAHRGLRRSFQKEQIADDLTVLENVLVQTDWSLTNARAKRAEAMAMRAAHFAAALAGERRWFAAEKAAKLVAEPELRIMFMQLACDTSLLDKASGAVASA